MLSVRCSGCQALHEVPDACTGKKVRCPRCDAIFIAHPPPTPPATDAPADNTVPAALRFACTGCGARIKVPAAAAGRHVRCPKCAATLRVPGGTSTHVAPAQPSRRASGDGHPSGLATSKTTAPPIARPKPKPAATPPVRDAGGPACPSCGRTYGPDAKICVACGVNMKSGRSIITTQDENLDDTYDRAEQGIRWISWLIPFGLYPIASEAFGLYKPHLVRALAVLTILTSLVFLVVVWTHDPALDSFRNFMLWCGDRQVLASALQQVQDLPPEREFVQGAPRAAVEQALCNRLAWSRDFRPMQLITHAFLHAGILHLAGNLLFLMVFGSRVNALVGNLWAAGLYPLLAVLSGLAHWLSSVEDPPHPMIGASGAIMGLAGMYLVLLPAHSVHMAIWIRWGLLWRFRLSLKIFTVRGFWVVLFYIAFDVAYVLLKMDDNVAHWAHIGGFVAGVAVAVILLVARLINARGGDLFSVVLGRHAWALIGRPRA